MEWLLWVCVVVVLGLGAVVAGGRFGELPTTQQDAPYPDLPDGSLTSADIAGVQFDVVLRGYSMTQVDELLARVRHQLEPWPAPAARAASSPDVAGPSAIMDVEESPQQPKEGEPWQQ